MLVYHFEGVPRSPLGIALKNILTLGIYSKVWLYRVNREMDGHEGFHIDLRWLGVMVALPIITPIVVKFQTARRMNQMVSHQVTLPLVSSNTLGWVSIVPVLGAGFYAWWVQSTLNKHWFHHRREERTRLLRDRIKRIALEDETTESLQKRFELEQEFRALEKQVEDEIEAAEIRWGEERFRERKRLADAHAAEGRLSRKELAALRAEQKKARKARAVKGIPKRGKVAGADPDDDAQWRPKTPLPDPMPDAIRAHVEADGREPSEAEEKKIEAAEKQIAKREKELAKLEAKREKLRTSGEKAAAKAEKAAQKQRLAEQKKAEKPAKDAKGKKGKKGKKGRKGKAGQGPAEGGSDVAPDKIPVTARRLRAPPVVHEAGSGPLRELTISCPRCQTQIAGVRKRGDAPAKITCPSCGLVGKV